MIILGFAGVILFGALILMLPISSVQGIITPFHKALFTSTSAVCVTGLAVVDTGSYWSAFWTDSDHVPDTDRRSGSYNNSNSRIYIIRKKISIMQRSTMQDAISAPKVGGIVQLMSFILKGTLLIELIGALFMIPVFCHDFGLRGIWMSIFHSVSAFVMQDLIFLEQMASICIIDIICGKSSDQHCDHVTDHHWWNWICYVGRHLSP